MICRENPAKIPVWQKVYGAVAGGRLELRPPVKSSDLNEKVLTITPARDTSSIGISRLRVN